jgi:hypothetical protein
MTNTTKMTKAQMYAQILTHLTNADEIAFIEHEMELLAKKNSARSTKPTKTQVANAGYMEEILNAMESGHAYTVSEIASLVPSLNGFSINKVSALVRGLKLDERVVRTEEKGKAYFTKAE